MSSKSTRPLYRRSAVEYFKGTAVVATSLSVKYADDDDLEATPGDQWFGWHAVSGAAQSVKSAGKLRLEARLTAAFGNDDDDDDVVGTVGGGELRFRFRTWLLRSFFVGVVSDPVVVVVGGVRVFLLRVSGTA